MLNAEILPHISSPIVVGVSGGVDSLSLLFMLKERGFTDLTSVYIDHGMRANSKEEKSFVESVSKKLGVRFLSRKIKFNSRHTEETLRRERYNELIQVCHDQNVSTLAIAHHLNDAIETGIKRVCEGSFISSWSSPKSVIERDDIIIIRPLLHIKKNKLIRYIAQKGVSPIYDESNDDETIQRNSIRKKLIPFLEKSVGKNVIDSLNNAFKLGEEITKYFSEKNNAVLVETHWGVFVPLNTSMGFIEALFFADQTMKKTKTTFSYVQKRQIALAISTGNQTSTQNKQSTCEIDCRGLYLYKGVVECSLVENLTADNSLLISNQKERVESFIRSGVVSVSLADSETIMPPDTSLRAMKLSKKYAAYKIPKWMRRLTPVIKTKNSYRSIFCKCQNENDFTRFYDVTARNKI